MTTETQNLADCLLCGGAASAVRREAGLRGTMGFDSWHAVRCRSCGMTLGESDRRFRTEEDAAKTWNGLMTKRSSHANQA
jgi:hypothetical protein